MRSLLVSGLSGMLAVGGCGEKVGAPAAAAPIRVAAASDLTRAFEEISRDFTRQTGVAVQLTFGSTGLLARQLRERAPFDVFAAASVTHVDEVVGAGVCDGATKASYGRGRVALWTRGSDSATGASITNLAELADARFARIAIANPEHAPYGVAAREALERAGLWEQLAPRVVYAENVRQALQFAESGNAEAALVALSLVIGGPRARYLVLDGSLHAPVEQTMVACDHGRNREGGLAFSRYVRSAPAREILARYGFLAPSSARTDNP